MAKYRYDIRRMAPARPMTGLWSTLTPSQKADVLAYDGPDNHGPAPGSPAMLALLAALRGGRVPPHASLGE